ncbi:MAG TPA: hypothetical protein PKN99_06830 [Cyclobacteriaceae bacterium]|nr:hypothetical protein [Cyclobacteriaceae bacterium]
MSTHKLHIEKGETYFCTIICYRWFSLFDEAEGYDLVYRWFEHLKRDYCQILGYVIMPNHLHCLLFPTYQEKSLNDLVSEGKRFMAYGIVKALKASGKFDLLAKLSEGVQTSERLKGKRHQVFRLSFDARVCDNERMLEQKLDYIHRNPVNGKWSLVEDFALYPYSSAAFYELNMENKYVTHYKELNNELFHRYV